MKGARPARSVSPMAKVPSAAKPSMMMSCSLRCRERPRSSGALPKSGNGRFLPELGRYGCRNRQQPISIATTRRLAAASVIGIATLKERTFCVAPQRANVLRSRIPALRVAAPDFAVVSKRTGAPSGYARRARNYASPRIAAARAAVMRPAAARAFTRQPCPHVVHVGRRRRQHFRIPDEALRIGPAAPRRRRPARRR